MKIFSTSSVSQFKEVVLKVAEDDDLVSTPYNICIEDVSVSIHGSSGPQLSLLPSQIKSYDTWVKVTNFFKRVSIATRKEILLFNGNSDIPSVTITPDWVKYDLSQFEIYVKQIEIADEDFKSELFKACLSLENLKKFEQNLYQNQVLKYQMANSFVFTLFEFNYNQKGALFEFKRIVFEKCDKDEFNYYECKKTCEEILVESISDEKIEEIRDKLLEYGEYNYGIIYNLALEVEQYPDFEFSMAGIQGWEGIVEEAKHVLKQMQEYESENDIHSLEYGLEDFERFHAPTYENVHKEIKFSSIWNYILFVLFTLALISVIGNQCSHLNRKNHPKFRPEVLRNFVHQIDSVSSRRSR
jgi:hypothetical protein